MAVLEPVARRRRLPTGRFRSDHPRLPQLHGARGPPKHDRWLPPLEHPGPGHVRKPRTHGQRELRGAPRRFRRRVCRTGTDPRGQLHRHGVVHGVPRAASVPRVVPRCGVQGASPRCAGCDAGVDQPPDADVVRAKARAGHAHAPGRVALRPARAGVPLRLRLRVLGVGENVRVKTPADGQRLKPRGFLGGRLRVGSHSVWAAAGDFPRDFRCERGGGVHRRVFRGGRRGARAVRALRPAPRVPAPLAFREQHGVPRRPDGSLLLLRRRADNLRRRSGRVGGSRRGRGGDGVGGSAVGVSVAAALLRRSRPVQPRRRTRGRQARVGGRQAEGTVAPGGFRSGSGRDGCVRRGVRASQPGDRVRGLHRRVVATKARDDEILDTVRRRRRRSVRRRNERRGRGRGRGRPGRACRRLFRRPTRVFESARRSESPEAVPAPTPSNWGFRRRRPRRVHRRAVRRVLRSARRERRG